MSVDIPSKTGAYTVSAKLWCVSNGYSKATKHDRDMKHKPNWSAVKILLQFWSKNTTEHCKNCSNSNDLQAFQGDDGVNHGRHAL